MKKIILYITILLLSLTKVASSQVASIQTVDGSFVGTTQVDVNLSDFTGANAIGAITMKIGFDPNVASFTGITYGLITSGINANVVGNEIIIAWSNTPAIPVNGIGFKLNFIYTGGSCNLSFNEGCEIADALGAIIQTTYLDGALHQPTIGTTAAINSQQGVYGVLNELPISFSNFPISPTSSLVGAISLHISYNSNTLQFVGIDGLPGASFNAANGIISLAWSNATPIDLNTINFKLKFNYLGGSSNVNFTGTNMISNANGIQIPVNFTNGGITQPPTAALVDIGDVMGQISGNTIVPVDFSGFTDLEGAVTMNIAYNSSALNFIGVSGLTGLNASAANGIIHLAWSNSAGMNITGFNLLFNYIGGSSTLVFTGQNEIAKTDGMIIPVTYTNGTVSQNATSVNVSLGNTVLMPGNSTVLVPINLTGAVSSVYATTMYVNFDNTKLTYVGLENAPAGVVANQDFATKTIIITWANTSLPIPLVLDKFLDLRFTFNGGIGNCDVPVYFTTFNSNASSLADNLGATVFGNWANGTVNVSPAAPTGVSAQTFPIGATVADLVAVGTGLQWYDAATGGNLLLSSTLLIDGNIYYASQTIGGCESQSRFAVTVTINGLTVTTNPVTNIIATGATFNGVVASPVPNPGVLRGFVYATHNNPTIGDAFTIQVNSGNGLGSYSSTVASLALNTNYWVRAFAQDGINITYGAAIPFTTVIWPFFNLELRNDLQVSSKIYEFDVYLVHTGNYVTPPAFELSTIQMGVYFNSAILNGGVATASVVAGSTSDINVGQRQTTANLSVIGPVSGNKTIKLTAKTTSAGLGTIISTTTGTRLMRIRLTNTNQFAQVQPNLAYSFTGAGPSWPTQVSAYISSVSKLINANGTFITSSLINPVLNGAFNVSGGGQYCAGNTPLGVYLDGSIVGYNYQLQKDGSNYGPVVIGTGSSLSWNVTEAGSYTVVNMNGSAVVTTTAAPSGSAVQSFCTSLNPLVSDLLVTGMSIVWYDAPTAGNIIPVSTPLISGTYYASQTISGCESPIRLAVTVIINANPTVVANTTATAVCDGGSVTLTGSGAVSYVWDNGVIDGVSFIPTTTTNYSVTGTDGNGCTNTAMVTVAVNPLPTVTANTTASTVCAGESVTLTGSGAVSYVWDNGVTDGLPFIPLTTITYSVTGTDGNGCQNTDNVNVAVNALPTVIANTTSSAVCEGESVTLTGSGASSYVWDNSVIDGTPFIPLTTLTYSVTGTDGNGCTNTASVAVTVNPLPGAPTGLATQSFTFAATVADLLPSGASIKWYDALTFGNLLLSTDLLVDGNTYYASQTVGSCESSDRLAVTVSITLFKTVNLHLILEGLYDENTNMMVEALDGNTGLPNYGTGIADKINIDLYNEIYPYNPIGVSLSGVDLSTGGLATFQIAAANSGNYYIKITSRNHLETWSAIAVPFNVDPVDYDFTSDVTQAYGFDAQAQVDASPIKYGFYLGDLDQSAYVDSDDYNIFEVDAILGSVGFLDTDFNGSGYVDSEDYNIFELRLILGIVSQRP